MVCSMLASGKESEEVNTTIDTEHDRREKKVCKSAGHTLCLEPLTKEPLTKRNKTVFSYLLSRKWHLLIEDRRAGPEEY